MLLLAHLSREEIPAVLQKDLEFLLTKGQPLVREMLGLSTAPRIQVRRAGGVSMGAVAVEGGRGAACAGRQRCCAGKCPLHAPPLCVPRVAPPSTHSIAPAARIRLADAHGGLH